MGEEVDLFYQRPIFSHRVTNFLYRCIKTTIGVLITKRTEMVRSACTSSLVPERFRWAVSHILYVLRNWEGTARIFDRAWTDQGADIIIYCDIALNNRPKKLKGEPREGSWERVLWDGYPLPGKQRSWRKR